MYETKRLWGANVHLYCSFSLTMGKSYVYNYNHIYTTRYSNHSIEYNSLYLVKL